MDQVVGDEQSQSAESQFKPVKGMVRLNDNNESVLSNGASQEFARLLAEELSHGYGFVPFIGAGMSAPSGAPLVWEIKTYLQNCIGLALGIEDGQTRSWNPRTDQWPAFTASGSANLDEWSHRIQRKIEALKAEDAFHPDLAVVQEALGAIAEWRTALQFLSRLVHEERDQNGDKTIGFVLDEPRQEVVDACLRAVLKGKQPTLGHRMLAALGGVLRLDLLLTTNFDDLLELAFAEARNPLTVFEVHLGSRLPAYSAVGAQRSVIKLHGNRHSLRADYTLDAEPTGEDLARFVDYLVTGDADRSQDRDPSLPTLAARNHLLVMGVRASERRTTAFIRYAWRRLRNTFKVFWVCHTPDDVARVAALTNKFHSDDKMPDDWKGSIVLRHTHLGLLFLHIYQYLRHVIPSSGLVFPTASRLALPPLGRRDEVALNTPTRSDLREKVKTRIQCVMNAVQSPVRRLIVVTSPHDIAGVTSVCADICEDLEIEAVCIWLDLNDVMDADDLFEHLLDAMYFRLGIEAWLPMSVASDTASRAVEIRRLAMLTTRNWVIFLNARETPGSNRPDYTRDGKHPNGWIDLEPGPGQDYACGISAFVDFLKQLCPSKAELPSITFVLLCRSVPSTNPEAALDSPIVDRLVNDWLVDTRDCYGLTESLGPGADKAVEDNCKKWLTAVPDDEEARTRFLHGIVLMERTRFFATIWQVLATDDKKTNRDYSEWLDALETAGLVRRKLGGFIWLHAGRRNMLREMLAPAKDKEDNKARTRLSELHWELAQWYHRILSASASPHALFEAMYHACRSVEPSLQILGQRPCCEAAARIGWATDVLRHHGFLVQTLGYSRGSCRKLEHIRDLFSGWSAPENANDDVKQFAEALRRLKLVCTETMRAIAREVGEVEKAYIRHQQARGFLALSPGKTPDELKWRGLSILCNTKPDNAVEFLRRLRWNGMLGIASRSYHLGEDALFKGLMAACSEAPPNDSSTLVNAIEEQCKNGANDNRAATALTTLLKRAQQADQTLWRVECRGPDALRLRIELLRISEQYIACRLQRFSADRRSSNAIIVDLDPLLDCTRLAHQLADVISAAGIDGRSAAPVAWCRSRLNLHRAFIASLMGKHDDALAACTNAEAALNLFDNRRFGTDRGIVELYRAETQLNAAWSTQVYAHDSSPMLFGQLIDTLIASSVTKPDAIVHLIDWFGNTTKAKLDDFATGLRASFAKAGAHVRDAKRFLDRGEDIFARRRRNSAWITWYFHRRLCAMSLAIWASLMDPKGHAIPFLGAEAVSEPHDTWADQLLDQSIGLIRSDAYRLATIVDAYSHCAMALRSRLIVDQQVPRLNKRQIKMQQRLSIAAEILSKVLNERKPPEGDTRRRDMYPSVEKHIVDTITTCRNRAECLRHIV